jgi:hypothetical protein
MANGNNRHTENLLNPSQVKLFGRVFNGLILGDVADKNTFGNKLLLEQLQGGTGDQSKAQLARIYGFAYEGNYYKLPAPSIFLVHGPGRNALEEKPTSVTNWGVEAKDERFADDVLVWEYDKEDMSIRIDTVAGFLSEILLDYALKAQNLQTGFSTKMQISHRGGKLME